jgi:hypothetical protein
MKKAIIFWAVLLVMPFHIFSQDLVSLEYISPFNEGLAAIKKEGQWAFINYKGEVVVDYRSDLVPTITNDDSYPVFMDGRCIIEQKKDGISYFGYIDATGKTAIQPQFLNAHNFKNGKALALKLIKENVAKNVALDKNIVYYKYYEVIIDRNGNVETFLNPSGVNITLDKDYVRVPPKITSKRISDDLYSVMDKNKKWALMDVNNQKK